MPLVYDVVHTGYVCADIGALSIEWDLSLIEFRD